MGVVRQDGGPVEVYVVKGVLGLAKVRSHWLRMSSSAMGGGLEASGSELELRKSFLTSTCFENQVSKANSE